MVRPLYSAAVLQPEHRLKKPALCSKGLSQRQKALVCAVLRSPGRRLQQQRRRPLTSAFGELFLHAYCPTLLLPLHAWLSAHFLLPGMQTKQNQARKVLRKTLSASAAVAHAGKPDSGVSSALQHRPQKLLICSLQSARPRQQAAAPTSSSSAMALSASAADVAPPTAAVPPAAERPLLEDSWQARHSIVVQISIETPTLGTTAVAHVAGCLFANVFPGPHDARR